MDYKELQSYWGLLNYVFDTYMSCRPFAKGMNLTMESWSPYRDSEVWKQEPDGMVSDIPEDNLGGES